MWALQKNSVAQTEEPAGLLVWKIFWQSHTGSELCRKIVLHKQKNLVYWSPLLYRKIFWQSHTGGTVSFVEDLVAQTEEPSLVSLTSYSTGKSSGNLTLELSFVEEFCSSNRRTQSTGLSYSTGKSSGSLTLELSFVEIFFSSNRRT